MSAEWQFLIALNERLRQLRDPIEIQDTAVRLLGEHLHANRVNYAQIDGDDYVVRRSYTQGVPPLPARGPIAKFGDEIVGACRRGETVVVEDVPVDARFTEKERGEILAGQTAAFVGVPLIKDGHWLATFGVHSATPRTWTSDQIALIEAAAERMWGSVERARAEEALGRSESRQAFLRRLNDAIRPLADPERILEEVCRLLGTHLRVNRVAYGEIEGDECIIVGEYLDGLPAQPHRFPWVAHGASRTPDILKGGTLSVSDTSVEPHTAAEREALQAAGIGAYLCPLLVKDGRFVGAFGIHNRTPRVWTPDEIALAQEVADRIWATLEHRKAEAELHARQHRFRLALSASGGGSWTWDLRTNHADWDDVFRARFGFGPDEPALFETWFACVHPDDKAWMRSTYDDVRRDKDTWDHTYRFLHPGGTVLWMQSLGRADRDAAGRVTRLTGLELDVTERRRTEEALQARREEEHDRELRLLVETAAQGVVSVDARGHIVMANRALEAMFGWAPGELIGQSIERLIPAAFRDRHVTHRIGYFAAPRPRSMGGGLSLTGARRDGSTFPVEVSLNHVATSSGGRAIAFVTDITDRQRAASALQERTAELEYRTTQLSQMAWDLTLAEHHAREQIARMLHDGLQQLLVIVSLNLDQQLKRERAAGAVPSELLLEAKRQLDEAVDAARSLHMELFPPVLHRTGLPAALRWLANWTHDKYKLRVDVDADPGADSPRKDVRTLLFESVRELLFNAFKHAQAERVQVDLTRTSDDRLRIVVSDDGAGFDSTRLDDRSRTRQSGWGLFSIRERLTLLGGSVDIDSAPGHGTRVCLFAPRDASPVRIGATEQDRTPIRSTAAIDDLRVSSDALRILIVDDHAALRTALRETLHERPQFTVVGDARNGLEAIAHAYTLRPDVILMDVAMPHMDGVDATRHIHAELPHIRILGLSMQASAEAVHPIEQAGAAGFFVKGADTQRLIDHLLVFHASRRRNAAV